jgi:hypothetical protein
MKNLIYYTLGSNRDYINLLNINLKSLERYKSIFDILIICPSGFDVIDNENFNIEYLYNDCDSMNRSSMNKFKIYQYDKIGDYENIIYSDIDIIWNGNPIDIFNVIVPHKINVSLQEDYMSHPLFGGDLLSLSEKEIINQTQTYGINAGFFCFKSNMSHIFKEIENFMYENIDLMNVCIEQPYFNVFLYRNKLYEVIDRVSHFGYSLVNNNTFTDDIVIHFAGGPGNYSEKFTKMNKFYENNKNKN